MRAKLFRPHQHVSNSISFITSVLLLSLFIPRYHAKNDTKLYKTCNETITRACGQPVREEIGFPFWGVGIRSRDCGLPGYELSCEESDLVVDIGSANKYLVVEIDLSAQVLQLKHRDNPLDYICESSSPSIPETRLNSKLYNYGQTTEGLHLFYNCSDEDQRTLVVSNFTCPNEYKDPVYFIRGNQFSPDLLRQAQRDLSSCSYTTLPVTRSALDDFLRNPLQQQKELFGTIFEVYYKNAIHQKACEDCKKAGGLCWMGTYPDGEDKCLFPEN